MTDTGIESSVMTKVKGFGNHNNRVMDVADYVFPSQVRDPDNAVSPPTQACAHAYIDVTFDLLCSHSP